MSECWEVDVVLCLYHGERYLDEFLNSLSLQENVRINLIVSDDSPKSEHVDILRDFENNFGNLVYLEGPRMGPAANFFFAIQSANAPYVALADQDDIWLPNHLADSIRNISMHPDVPSLVFSRVIESDNSSLWPPIDSFKLSENLFENYARGCTFLMNRRFVEYIPSREPKDCIMHDWWILLLCASIGKVVFLHEPALIYRIHRGNFSSPRRRLLIRVLRGLISSRIGNRPVKQVVSVENYTRLEQIPSNGTLKLLLMAILHPKENTNVYRQIQFRRNIFENVSYKILINLERKRGRFRDVDFNL
jgi:glycosyltransferase involved in cell wall biosynthesis